MRIACDSDRRKRHSAAVHRLSDPVGLIQIDADFRIWCGRRKTAQGLFGFGIRRIAAPSPIVVPRTPPMGIDAFCLMNAVERRGEPKHALDEG
jgi:hypothetical protein